MQTRYIPISSVAEILYCPRNFYYRMVESADQTNHHLTEGLCQEELREARHSQTRGDLRQVRRLTAQSDYYGIVGVFDIVEEKNGAVYPVEYKKGILRNNQNDDVQVCCQALLLEEGLGISVDRGFIYYAASKSRRPVPITTELREMTVAAIEKARAILEDNVIPEPVNDQRCNGCALVDRCLPEESNYLNNKQSKPRRIVPSINLGRTLYVDSQGCSLKKKGGCICVTKEEQTVKELPINSIDQVVLFGGINVTTPLLGELLRRGIPTYFCSGNGRLSGWLQPS